MLLLNLSTVLRSTNALNVNFFLLLYKVLTTSKSIYLNNLISVQPARSTRSSSVVDFSRPPTISSLKITDRSFRYASPIHPVSGINSQIHSVSLASHVSTHLLIHLSAHLCRHHHSHHPSLLHSLTPGLKPTILTNPSHLNTSPTLGLPSRLWDWTGFIAIMGLDRIYHDYGTGPDLSAFRSIFSSFFCNIFVSLSLLHVSFLLQVHAFQKLIYENLYSP